MDRVGNPMANPPDLRSELAATEQAVAQAAAHLDELTQYRDSLRASCNGQSGQSSGSEPEAASRPTVESPPAAQDEFDVTTD